MHVRTLTCGLLLIAALQPLHADFNDISRVSVSSAGISGESNASSASISGDGNLVVFDSSSTNLVSAQDKNLANDIFLRNRVAGTTIRVSSALSGFAGNGESVHPAISSDGSTIAFASAASDLSATTDNNGLRDIYVYSVATGSSMRISVDVGAVQANGESANPALSSSGRYIVFQSAAFNLVPNDTNGALDIFIRDRDSNAISLVSKNLGSTVGNGASSFPAVNGDGTRIVFQSDATNLAILADNNDVSDIYLRDTVQGNVLMISVAFSGLGSANGASALPSISTDGRYVAFQSLATDLTASTDSNGASDIFVRDVQLGTTTQVSKSSFGVIGNGSSVSPRISADGSTVVFLSDSTNLAQDDNNNKPGDGSYDVFSYRLATGEVTRISRTFYGYEVSGTAGSAAINDSGSVFAFDYSGMLTSATSDKTQGYVVDKRCTVNDDGDGAVNCSDACPVDASKIELGSCGCGVPETDNDGDGVANCVDLCPTDVNKSNPGVCGCNVADTDLNGNGAPDCLDPDENTVPVAPSVNVKGRKITVTIPTAYPHDKYTILLLRNKNEVDRKTTKSSSTTFKVSSTGTYNVRYIITFQGVTTQKSKGTKAVVR